MELTRDSLVESILLDTDITGISRIVNLADALEFSFEVLVEARFGSTSAALVKACQQGCRESVEALLARTSITTQDVLLASIKNDFWDLADSLDTTANPEILLTAARRGYERVLWDNWPLVLDNSQEVVEACIFGKQERLLDKLFECGLPEEGLERTTVLAAVVDYGCLDVLLKWIDVEPYGDDLLQLVNKRYYSQLMSKGVEIRSKETLARLFEEVV